MARRPLRIANFSGFLGDHFAAFEEVVRGEPVDVAVGDYLAEITMGMVSAQLRATPELQREFYAEIFLKQLFPQLERVAERGLKVVANAGAFNPRGMASAIRAEIQKRGLALRVAHVEGDDVLARVGALSAEGALTHLDTGAALGSRAGEIFAANAYLGGWGIAAALREGADIVICGRVADASLVVGPAAWWHGWGNDAWDRLAGAVAAGHIIECGPQANGGNFSGFAELPRATRLGFPIAEIADDGSSVITKRAGEGGTVNVDTVTAQLLYEIQGPRYLNPDVVLHLGSVRLTLEGPDRVRMHGISGGPPPPTTKVGCFYPNGHCTVLWSFATGLDVEEKLAWLGEQMRSCASALELDDYHFTPCGRPYDDPENLGQATVVIRIAAAAKSPQALQRLAAGFASFGLGGIPGFYGETIAPVIRPRIEYWPGLLRQDALQQRVVLDDGRTLAVALPPTAALAEPPPVAEPPIATPPADELAAASAETVRVALGELVHARSGDKGGNANLGVWAREPRAFPWLSAYLTSAELGRLLGLAGGVSVERHTLPNVHGLLFVLKGYFGASGTGNIGLDQIGKAVGEHLRARKVEAPPALLRETENPPHGNH